MRNLLNAYPQEVYTSLLCKAFIVFYVPHTSWTLEIHSLFGWGPGLTVPHSLMGEIEIYRNLFNIMWLVLWGI